VRITVSTMNNLFSFELNTIALFEGSESDTLLRCQEGAAATTL
jgi:hypothetical protein